MVDIRSKTAVRKKEASGFTLIELIIVIAMIAVVSAVAVPNFLIWRESIALNGAAQDFLSVFQKAKLEAVKRHEYCTVAFNTSVSGTAYSAVAFEDPDRDLVYDAGESVFHTLDLDTYGGDVSFDTSQGGGDGFAFTDTTDHIAFGGDGLSKTRHVGELSSGTVYLKNARGNRVQVIVNMAGNVRIAKP